MAQQDQAEIKPKAAGGVCVGVVAGFALLLFAGALVATSQIPGTGQANLRQLQVITDLGATTPAPALNVQTTVAADALVNSLVLTVADASVFVVGQWVSVGFGTNLVEMRHIKDIEANVLGFHKPLVSDHKLGEVVVLMPEDSADQSANQISSGSSDSLKSLKSSDSSSKSLDSSASLESGSSEGNILKTMTNTEAGSSGIGWLVNFLLGMCYACAYKSKVVEPMGVMRHQPLQHEMHNDFRFGLCDCFKDINICLMAWCCPFVRMAHTNEAADVCGFWETLMCIWCSSLCLCGPLCLQVYFRIHIKDHMGIQDHCFNDFCAAFWCLPCVTGQQAMAVDEVLGWKFKCPCNIEHVSSSGGYGQAGNWS